MSTIRASPRDTADPCNSQLKTVCRGVLDSPSTSSTCPRILFLQHHAIFAFSSKAHEAKPSPIAKRFTLLQNRSNRLLQVWKRSTYRPPKSQAKGANWLAADRCLSTGCVLRSNPPPACLLRVGLLIQMGRGEWAVPWPQPNGQRV